MDYAPAPNLSERVDRILLHKVWGLLVFTIIMTALFVSIFWLAQPIMDWLQTGIKALGSLAISRLSPRRPDPRSPRPTASLPASARSSFSSRRSRCCFMFISILEDTGYLARAAFLMDRLLAKVGLHGKSFIPLLSSFACAIPGIMATRTIENRKDRLATIFIAPFMNSARLPVYALLISAFFASYSAPRRPASCFRMLCHLGILAAVGNGVDLQTHHCSKGGSGGLHPRTCRSYKIPQMPARLPGRSG